MCPVFFSFLFLLVILRWPPSCSVLFCLLRTKVTPGKAVLRGGSISEQSDSLQGPAGAPTSLSLGGSQQTGDFARLTWDAMRQSRTGLRSTPTHPPSGNRLINPIQNHIEDSLFLAVVYPFYSGLQTRSCAIWRKERISMQLVLIQAKEKWKHTSQRSRLSVRELASSWCVNFTSTHSPDTAWKSATAQNKSFGI